MEDKEKMVCVSFEIKARVPVDQVEGNTYMQKLTNWKEKIQEKLEKELVRWNAWTDIACTDECILNED